MRRIGDVCALVSALTNLGTAELRADNLAGRVKLERSLALARRFGLDEPAVRAFGNLADWGPRDPEVGTRERLPGSRT